MAQDDIDEMLEGKSENFISISPFSHELIKSNNQLKKIRMYTHLIRKFNWNVEYMELATTTEETRINYGGKWVNCFINAELFQFLFRLYHHASELKLEVKKYKNIMFFPFHDQFYTYTSC